jgi:hypothetical protein
MKKIKAFLNSILLAFLVLSISVPSPALALSNIPGSDPTGKSQRSAIEEIPWYDPTACTNTSVSPSGGSGVFGTEDPACRGVYYPKVSNKDAFAAALTKYIKSEKPKSPMGTDEIGKYLVDAGEKYNVNPMMLVAMAYQESQLCTDSGGCKDTLNPWGNLTSSRKLVKYSSWEQSIYKWAEWVKTAHIEKANKTTLALELAYHCGTPNIETNTPGVCNGPAYYKNTIERMSKMIEMAGSALACSGSGTSQASLVSSGCQCPSTLNAVSSAGINELDGKKLPAYKGGAGFEQPINEEGFVTNAKGEVNGGKVTFSKYANLGKEYRDYYIAMRWRYAKWDWKGDSQPGPEDKAWYEQKEPRKVLVTNTRNGRSIIAAVLESGPAPWTGITSKPSSTDALAVSQKALWEATGQFRDGTPEGYLGRVAGFPPVAQQALDYKQWQWGGPGQLGGSGDELVYSWAPDQNAKPGPVNITGSTPIIQASGSGNIVCDQNSLDLSIQPGRFVYYSQVDPKWAKFPYAYAPGCGSRTISSSGCGPTSTAMVLSTLLGKAITPPDVVQKYGPRFQMSDCGSSWGMFKAAAQDNGLKYSELGQNMDKVIEALRGGALILAGGQGAKPFSSGGHIIVLKGLDANGNIIVANPGSLKGDNEVYPPSQVAAGLMGAFAISK